MSPFVALMNAACAGMLFSVAVYESIDERPSFGTWFWCIANALLAVVGVVLS